MPRLLSPEEYVALEQKLGVKHEYHDGQVFAMEGVSAPHSRLQVTLAAGVQTRLRGASSSAASTTIRKSEE